MQIKIMLITMFFFFIIVCKFEQLMKHNEMLIYFNPPFSINIFSYQSFFYMNIK